MFKVIAALLLSVLVFAETPPPVSILSLKAGTCAGFTQGSAGAVICASIQPNQVPTLNQNTTGFAALNVLKTGDTMTGALSMSGNPIHLLADPTGLQDAATKNYVDVSIATIPTNGLPLTGGAMSGAINMASNFIHNLPSPVAGGDATDKTYVDTGDAVNAVAVGAEASTRSTADIALQSNISAEAARAEAAEALRLPLAGGTMTGALNMNGNSISSIPEPANASSPATKNYVDTAVSAINLSAYFKKDGSVLATGAFNLGGFAITNLADPTAASYAATKHYVDLGDQTNATAITTEATARSTADTTLQSNITAEATTRGTADTGLQSNITAETTRAEGVEATLLPLAGGTLSGAINAASNPIHNLPTPSLGGDASNKSYVDAGDGANASAIAAEASTRSSADTTLQSNITAETTRAEGAEALLLPLAGGAMSGAINMGGNLITAASNPVNEQDVATKNYVDTHSSAGTPVGPDQSLQYNNSGSFAGSSAMLFNGSQLSLNLTDAYGGLHLLGHSGGESSFAMQPDTVSNGSCGQWIFYTNGSGQTSQNDFAFYDSCISAPVFTLQSATGFLGIGTNNPSVQLDVAGDAHVSGTLNLSGNIAPTTAGLVQGTSSFPMQSIWVNEILAPFQIDFNLTNGVITNNTGSGVTDFNNELLNDVLAVKSVDWNNRQLFNTAGNLALDWSVPNVISTGGNSIAGLPTPTAASYAAPKSYVDAGDTANATAISSEATTRATADTGLQSNITAETSRAEGVEATLLPLAGGTMSGSLNMGGNLITAASNPVNAQDVATKNYVDTSVAAIPASANPSLSNLTSPTSINQPLLPNGYGTQTSGSVTLPWAQIDANAFRVPSTNFTGATGTITTGSPTITSVTDFTHVAAAGDVWGTGIPLGARVNSFNAGAGTITLNQNATVNTTLLPLTFTQLGGFRGEDPAANMYSSSLFYRTGNTSGATSSGALYLNTGSTTSTLASGQIFVQSGATTGAASSGAVNVQSGQSSNAASGNTNINTFFGSGSNGSGTVNINTGTAVNGNSGNINVIPGSVSGTGTKGSVFIGGTAINLQSPINASSNPIHSVLDPISPQDAATKNYVDAAVAGGGSSYLPLSGGTMSGNINMGAVGAITALNDPVNAHDAANKEYVDAGDTTNSSAISSEASTRSSADTTLQSNITAEVTRAEGAEALLLPLSGGVMTGTIDMGSNALSGLPTPVAASYAATKSYVDTAISALPTSANTTLSNLTSPTSINQPLLPNGYATQTIGSASFPYTQIDANAYRVPSMNFTYVGNIVAGTPATITGIPLGSAGIAVFSDIWGPGIPQGTRVNSINGGTGVLTLNNTTAITSASSVSLTFPQLGGFRGEDQTISGADTGSLYIRSGNTTGNGGSGLTYINTGTTNGTIPSGNVNLSSGAATGSGTASGNMLFGSGTSSSGNTGTVTIYTQSSANAFTGSIGSTTGAATGANGTSGNANFGTGGHSNASNANTTGSTNLTTGNTAGTGNSGQMSINTGQATTGTSGNTNIGTGQVSSGTSGTVNIFSGGSTGSTGASGQLSLGTGQHPVGNTATTGSAFIGTGAHLGSGNSGSLGFSSGQVATGTSGQVSMGSGQATGSTGNSGNTGISTGPVVGTGVSGNLNLDTGPSVNGDTGNINIFPGSASGSGTPGSVFIGGTSISLQAPISANSNQIHNVVDPASSQDVATKNYVDSGGAYVNAEPSYRAASNSTCTTSPCTLDQGSGWITSVTRTSTGVYVANFAPGAFTNTPTCTLQGNSNSSSTVYCNGNNINGTTSATFTCASGAVATATDSAFALICVGK